MILGVIETILQYKIKYRVIRYIRELGNIKYLTVYYYTKYLQEKCLYKFTMLIEFI